MGGAIVGAGEGYKVRIRLAVAVVAEFTYLFGRSAIISVVDDPFYRELMWTGWRLAFVLLYLWLFFDIIRNAERRPLSRNPLLVISIIIFLGAMPFAHGGGGAGWIELVAVPLVALREEFFYRAILQNALEHRFQPLLAVLITTALFALSHIGAQPISLATLSSFVVCGVVLGVVYQHTRNIWIVVALHAAADFIVVLPYRQPLGPSIALVANFVATLGALIWWSKTQYGRRTGE
jgi:membrane protease YdiL (CAAX protease family)